MAWHISRSSAIPFAPVRLSAIFPIFIRSTSATITSRSHSFPFYIHDSDSLYIYNHDITFTSHTVISSLRKSPDQSNDRSAPVTSSIIWPFCSFIVSIAWLFPYLSYTYSSWSSYSNTILCHTICKWQKRTRATTSNSRTSMRTTTYVDSFSPRVSIRPTVTYNLNQYAIGPRSMSNSRPTIDTTIINDQFCSTIPSIYIYNLNQSRYDSHNELVEFQNVNLHNNLYPSAHQPHCPNKSCAQFRFAID